MTKRIALLTFLLTFALGAFAQTAAKTFTKAFNTQGKSKISFELPGQVDLKIWNQPTIRLEIIVGLPTGNSSVVDQLAKVGRYDLVAEEKEDMLAITAPNLGRVVKVKGEELRENVSYIIFVPKDLEIILHGATAVATVEKN